MLKNYTKNNSNRINKILIVLLVLLIATLIKVYPVYQYSFESDGYKGLGEQRSNYVWDTGHTLTSGRGEVILDKLGYAKSLILSEVPTGLNLLLNSFFLSATFFMVILLFAIHYSNGGNISLGLGAILLIAFFSISATPDIIIRLSGWNGPYAWIFFMLSLYFLICKRKNRINIGLGLLFLFMLPLTYFTFALYVAVILAVAFVYQLIFRKNVFPQNTIVFYEVFFLSWLIYMSVCGFNTIVGSFNMFQSVAHGESRIFLLKYIAGGSTISVIKNGLCIFFASVPFIYFIGGGYKFLHNKIRSLFMIFIVGTTLIAGGMFVWAGLTGVIQRSPILVALFSILLFSIILGVTSLDKKMIKRYKNIFLLISIVLVVILSNYSYLTSDYNSSKISFSEAKGVHWLIRNIDKQDVIFTDFMLSGPFVARGYETIIINDASYPERVNQLLEDIYYNSSNPMKSLKSLQTNDGKRFDYLFFSDRLTDRFPGLKGYDYNYLPAPKNYLQKYDNSVELNLIYRNKDVTIYI